MMERSQFEFWLPKEVGICSNFGECIAGACHGCEVYGDTEDPTRSNGDPALCDECFERFHNGKGAEIPEGIDDSIRGNFNVWRELCKIDLWMMRENGSEEQRQEAIRYFIIVANEYAEKKRCGSTMNREQQMVSDYFA